MNIQGRLKLLLLLLLVGSVSATDARVVAVLNSKTAKPYLQTVEGFEAGMDPTLGVEFLHLGDEAGLAQLRARPPALIFALGSKALQVARKAPVDSPLLAAMVVNAKLLPDDRQATAVLLQTTPREQLLWHRRMLPHARRVGVLYNPAHSQQWVERAQQAATDLGLEILAIPVHSAKELPAALKALSRGADSLLGIADKTIYSSKTAKAIALFSFRNRIPFVGLSGAWVKAGALYALDWDYTELGRQCAAIAQKILAGEKASRIGLQQARRGRYQLNLKTAKHLKLEISPALIEGASRVYE